MKHACVIAIGLLVLVGCRSEDPAVSAKLDAPLRQKAEQLYQTKQRETLSVFGKCRTAIDNAMKNKIVKTGATLTSANNDIFSARVPSERLMTLARLEFVTQLQLSQTSQPSSP